MVWIGYYERDRHINMEGMRAIKATKTRLPNRLQYFPHTLFCTSLRLAEGATEKEASLHLWSVRNIWSVTKCRRVDPQETTVLAVLIILLYTLTLRNGTPRTRDKLRQQTIHTFAAAFHIHSNPFKHANCDTKLINQSNATSKRCHR
jgi:hypothetical protein